LPYTILGSLEHSTGCLQLAETGWPPPFQNPTPVLSRLGLASEGREFTVKLEPLKSVLHTPWDKRWAYGNSIL